MVGINLEYGYPGTVDRNHCELHSFYWFMQELSKDRPSGSGFEKAGFCGDICCNPLQRNHTGQSGCGIQSDTS